MATPTLVQHVVWTGNGNSGTGNTFKLQLPNATLANNCLILALEYPDTVTTITITDNAAGGTNTWPSTPTVSVDDSGNSMLHAIFVLPNAYAGATQITVVFNAAILGFKPCFQEWYNIATSSPLDGSHTAIPSTTAVASGSFNTTVDGDLILHFGATTDLGNEGQDGQFDGWTKVTKATGGYAFCQVDLNDGYFCEYLVQGTHGATNPSATLTLSAGAYSTCSITFALKSATSGTAPSATAMRIFGMNHNRLQGTGATGNLTYPVQFPTVGNTFVATCSDPPASIALVSVSGATSGAWTTITTSGEEAQACYKTSGTPSTDELLTFTLNDSSAHVYVQGCLYDIVNGAAYDTFTATVDGTGFGPGNSTPAATITPGVSSGMVIACFGIQTGPPDSVVTPSGAVFLSCYYTGEGDASYMDNGDFHGYYVYSSNAAQSWVFHDTVATTGYQPLLISIAAAAAGNNITPNVGALALTGQQPTVSAISNTLIIPNTA